MAERGSDPVEGYEDLLARVAGASSGIVAEPSAGGAVRRALARRRRRRTVVAGVGAGAAVAAVIASAALVAVRRDPVPEPPAEQPTTPSAVAAGLYRPAGFFEDLAGGTAVPTITRHHVAPGINFTAPLRLDASGGDAAYLASIARERYRRSAVLACGALAGGSATCDERDDGTVVGTYAIPSSRAYLAPVQRGGPLEFRRNDPTLSGVTSFGPDGLAISVLVCTCSATGGVVLSDEVPVSTEVLTAVVTDPSWAKEAE